MLAIVALLAILGLDALLVAHLFKHNAGRDAQPRAPRTWGHAAPSSWGHPAPAMWRLAPGNPRIEGVVERSRAARGVLVHPCSFGDDLIEYPVHAEFDADDVLATLHEIERL